MTNDIRTNRTAVIDPAAMGIEVSWGFGHGSAEAVTIPRTVLRGILILHGFPAVHLVDPDESKCLKRAANLATRSNKFSIKQLARPNKDTPLAFGVYERRAVEGEAGDDWAMGARVRVNGNHVVAMAPEGSDYGTVGARSIADTMARQANTLIQDAFNLDISEMLVSVGNSLGWINRRRNSGGVYFLRSTHGAARFVKLLLALKSETASHHTSRQYVPEIIEIYPRPLAKATIADAAEHHFETKTRQLVAQLKTAATDFKMRPKTMEARAQEAQDLIDQATAYQEFLTNGATEITARLAEVLAFFNKGAAAGAEELAAEMDAFDRLCPPVPAAPVNVTPVTPQNDTTPHTPDAVFG